MGGSYFANPAPNREYPGVYPIDDGISDKIPEMFANLGIVKSHGRKEQQIISGTFKVSFEGHEKLINPNALPNNFHKVHLRGAMPAQ